MRFLPIIDILNFMNLSRINKFILFFLPALLILIALRNYLILPGIALLPELMYSQDFIVLLQNHLHAWDNSVSLGHSNIVYPEAIGDRQIYGSIAPLSTIPWLFFLSLLQALTGEFAQKVYFFFILLLPFIGMIPLARYWFKNDKNQFLPILTAILFYGANLTITGRFLAASMNHNLAVGLFPIVIYSYLKLIDGIKEKKQAYYYIYYTLLGGILLSFIIQLRIHFLIILGVFVSFYFFFSLFTGKKILLESFKKTIFQTIIPFLTILLISALLNIHQWLPLLFFKETTLEAPELAAHTLSMLLVSNDYVSIINSITLLSNIIGAKSLLLANYKISVGFIILLFIPAIISLLTIFVKKSPRKTFLGVIIAISIILSSGLNSPFGEVFKWFYLNTPLLDPFRDPSKFLTLTTVGYSLLIGEFFLLFIKREKIQKVVFSIFIIFIFISNPVFFSGDFFGNLKNVEIPKAYYSFREWTKKQNNDQERIFLLPAKTVTYQYKWFPKNVSFPYTPNLFHGILPLDLPLANTGWNNSFYGMRFYHYVDTQINQNLPKLLWKVNAKYVVTDTAFEEGDLYNQKLGLIPSFNKIKELGNLTVYKNVLLDKDDTLIKFYPKFAYVAGDIPIATFSGKIPLVDFSANINNLNKSSDIFVFNRNVDDIIFKSLFKTYYLNPVSHFIKSKGASNHDWTDGTGDIGPYEKGMEIISPAPMTTYTSATLPLLWNADKNDDYAILSRVGFNKDNGKVSFLIDGKKIKTVNLDNEFTGFTTINLGTYFLKKGKHSMEIVNEKEGKITVIDGVIIIPSNVFNNQKNKLIKILSKNGALLCTSDYKNAIISLTQNDPCKDNKMYKKIILDNLISNFFEDEEKKYPSNQVEYKSENNSLYYLNKQEKNNGLLIFNQAYSPYWKLNGKSSVLTNFYANGFILEDNFLYKNNVIEYKPEKIYRTGIYLSAFFYLVTFGGLLILFLKLRGLSKRLLPAMTPKRSGPKNNKQNKLKSGKKN